jgi:hypothetical protein
LPFRGSFLHCEQKSRAFVALCCQTFGTQVTNFSPVLDFKAKVALLAAGGSRGRRMSGAPPQQMR